MGEEIEVEIEELTHSKDGKDGSDSRKQHKKERGMRKRVRRRGGRGGVQESSQRFPNHCEQTGLEQLIEQNKPTHANHPRVDKKGRFHSWFQSSSSSLSSSMGENKTSSCESLSHSSHKSFSSQSYSSSNIPTAYEAAFSHLPRFSSEFVRADSNAIQNKYRQRDVMGIEILSTGEKTYFTKSLRDLCVIVNQIADDKEQARYKDRNRAKNDGCGTGWMVPRDLRRLDFSFFPNLEPQILPRRHCLIFAIEQLRGLLTEDRLILLLPEGADEFLQMLDKRLTHTLEYPKLSTKKYSLFSQPEPFFLSSKQPYLSTTRGVFSDTVVDPPNKDILKKEKKEGERKGMQKGEGERKRMQKGEGEREAMQEGEEEGGEEEEGEAVEGEEGMVFLSFELRVIDSILETVVWLKQRELKFISDHKEEFFSRLKRQSSLLTSTAAQEELRTLRTEVLTMTTRLTNIRRVLEGLLDNEEDMALFNLSLLAAKPQLYDPPLQPEILEAHAEVELLLEAYLQNFHEILTDLDVMIHELNATEALMALRLDTARNQLLTYTTIFSLIGMAFSIGSYVGSLFGTNLENGLENSGTAVFVYVCVGTFVGVVLIIVGFGLWLYEKGMLVK